MKREYRDLRLKQLATTLSAFGDTKRTPWPGGGWLRAVREAPGVTQSKVAKTMHVKQQSIVSFEKAEAMGCELVYAIVPKSGSIQELAESRAEATKRALSVRGTMALEDWVSA